MFEFGRKKPSTNTTAVSCAGVDTGPESNDDEMLPSAESDDSAEVEAEDGAFDDFQTGGGAGDDGGDDDGENKDDGREEKSSTPTTSDGAKGTETVNNENETSTVSESEIEDDDPASIELPASDSDDSVDGDGKKETSNSDEVSDGESKNKETSNTHEDAAPNSESNTVATDKEETDDIKLPTDNSRPSTPTGCEETVTPPPSPTPTPTFSASAIKESTKKTTTTKRTPQKEPTKKDPTVRTTASNESSSTTPSEPLEPLEPLGPRTPDDPIPPPNPQEKNRSFQNLKSYEAKRRQIYTAKLTSSSYYWRAFREMLSTSLQETERAEGVVRAGLLAAINYQAALSAAADDRLDTFGKAVTDPGRVKKLKEEKRRKYARLGSGGKSPFAILQDNLGVGGKASVADTVEVDQKERIAAEENEGQSGGMLSRRTLTEFDADSIVKALLESQSAMADRFQDNITFVTENSQKKLTMLKQELESEIFLITMLGDAIIEELERAEQDVQDAWSAYFTKIHQALAANSSDLAPPTLVSRFAEQFSPTDIADVWVVEMHYRMSVAYLTTTWEQSSTELSKLFQSMKEVECNRRFRLRELLLVHMQRQERLWTSIPTLITPVINDLMHRSTDIPTVEKEVQNHIRSRAADIKRDKDNADVKKAKSRLPSEEKNDLSFAEELDPDYELVSPLMSELLLKADVVEKKVDMGIIGKWKTTLAVATSDSFLHFFDLPAGSGVRAGSAAEVAFQALVPPINVPSEDMIKNGKLVFGKSWYEYLIPADSVSLKNSTISLNESKGDCIFEVTENIVQTGAAKLFNLKSVRKFSIKLFSSHEMVSWLLALGMAN